MDMSTDWRCWIGIEDEALPLEGFAWWTLLVGGDGDMPLWLLGDGETDPMEPIPVRRRERGRGTLSS